MKYLIILLLLTSCGYPEAGDPDQLISEGRCPMCGLPLDESELEKPIFYGGE